MTFGAYILSVGKGNVQLTIENQAFLDRVVSFSIDIVKQKEVSLIEQNNP
jgi:hypothetical protein